MTRAAEHAAQAIVEQVNHWIANIPTTEIEKTAIRLRVCKMLESEQNRIESNM